jgi:membrane protein DedA with SNARE-associated domain
MFDPSFPMRHVPHLVTLADAHPFLVYGGIFIAMVLEGGEAVLFSAIFLIHKGVVDSLIILPLMYVGVIMSDLLWYLCSPYVANWPVMRSIIKLASVFDQMIIKRPFRAFMMSKFAYGLHHPMIARFALLKVSKRKFIEYSMILSFAWVVLVSLIGFGVFASIAYIEHFVRFAEIGITLAIVGFFIIERLVGTYVESLAVGKTGLPKK